MGATPRPSCALAKSKSQNRLPPPGQAVPWPNQKVKIVGHPQAKLCLGQVKKSKSSAPPRPSCALAKSKSQNRRPPTGQVVPWPSQKVKIVGHPQAKFCLGQVKKSKSSATPRPSCALAKSKSQNRRPPTGQVVPWPSQKVKIV